MQLDLNRSTMDVVKEACQGNPGGLSVIMRVQTYFEDWVFPCWLSDLYKKEIFGSEIWGQYKDVYKEDFLAFANSIWTGAAPLENYYRDKDGKKE